MTEIKGWHVLGGFVGAFGIIIAVNLTLAYQAIRTFPGLEVANSYVASQSFDEDRAAQEALGWKVTAWLADGDLRLRVLEEGRPIAPRIETAIFGRATSVAQDQVPEFVFDGQSYVAPVGAAPGNWNLRLRLRAEDDTLFMQRVIVGDAP